MTSHSPASSPELPKPYTTAKELVGIGERDFFIADQMNAHYLKGYEDGSAAAAQAAWRPIAEAAQALVNAWPTGYSRTTHEAMAALQAALAANTPAGDDTRRLDWLSSTPASVVSDKQVREWLWKRPAGFDGIRRAIDAAMGNPDHTAPTGEQA